MNCLTAQNQYYLFFSLLFLFCSYHFIHVIANYFHFFFNNTLCQIGQTNLFYSFKTRMQLMRRSMKRLKTFKQPRLSDGASSEPNTIPLESIGGKHIISISSQSMHCPICLFPFINSIVFVSFVSYSFINFIINYFIFFACHHENHMRIVLFLVLYILCCVILYFWCLLLC